MNKKILYLSIILCFLVFASPVTGEDAEKYDPIQTALALNYCQMSVSRMVTYNDKVVLDQEYDNIINNINLRKIEDREIVKLLVSLMDSLTESKITAGDKEWLQKEHDRQLEKAVYEGFSESAGYLSAAATSVATQNYAAAAGNVAQVGMQFFNYRKVIEENNYQLDKSKWALEKNTLDLLNYQRKKMLKTSWELLRRYKIPDEWRLTEKQIKNYIEVLKDENAERRLRKLSRMVSEFQAYPPFWYFYGKTAQDIGNRDLALECYTKYEIVWKGIFRSDPFYSSTCMNRITLLDPAKDRDEILRNLEVIRQQSRNDANLLLFCSLKYLELQQYEKAKELIQTNIDNEYEVSLNERLMGEVHLGTSSSSNLTKLIDEMIKNDNVKNQDILYLVGRARQLDLLKKIEKQLKDIELVIEPSVFSKDDILVKLPVKWLFEDLEVTLNFEEKQFEMASAEADEQEKAVVCLFESVMEEDEYIENKEPKMFTLRLKHASYPMDLLYLGEIKEEGADGIGGKVVKSQYVPNWVKEKLKDSGATDKKKETRIVFSLQEIHTSQKVYAFKNGSIAKK